MGTLVRQLCLATCLLSFLSFAAADDPPRKSLDELFEVDKSCTKEQRATIDRNLEWSAHAVREVTKEM